VGQSGGNAAIATRGPLAWHFDWKDQPLTIAISLKVQEGVVLAADSASTLMDPVGNVVNVYDNANKIVNLHKGLPLGIMTWGAGSIGPVSMTTIFKDLRSLFSGDRLRPDGESWKLDPKTYSVKDVAILVQKYVHDELYVAAYGQHPKAPAIGMIVAGFSAVGDHAEEYQLDISGEGCPEPDLLRPNSECGLTVGGQPQTISRLVFGVDPAMPTILQANLGVPPEQVGEVMTILQSNLQAQVIQDAMPFQDALDLAEFLVDATIKMTRFLPGAPTVGGPIEVAGITKHEGFKWVQRKHYFASDLNPREMR
jgi:hypothetical protein